VWNPKFVNNVEEIEPEKLVKALSDQKHDFLLIDVRENEELADGSLAGSIHIPMSQFKQRFQEIPRDQTIIVYCAHGVRSFHIAAFLGTRGYHAISLKGGFAEWQEKQYNHQ
jgi:rhodanese-related sulfurtransferase